MATRWQESLRKATAMSGLSVELPSQASFMGDNRSGTAFPVMTPFSSSTARLTKFKDDITQNHLMVNAQSHNNSTQNQTVIDDNLSNDRMLELSAVARDQLNNFSRQQHVAGAMINEDALPSNVLAGGLFSTGSLETELLAFLGGDISVSPLTGW